MRWVALDVSFVIIIVIKTFMLLTLILWSVTTVSHSQLVFVSVHITGRKLFFHWLFVTSPIPYSVILLITVHMWFMTLISTIVLLSFNDFQPTPSLRASVCSSQACIVKSAGFYVTTIQYWLVNLWSIWLLILTHIMWYVFCSLCWNF